MEPVWNHMLTCDYERTRADATRLEWDLYTRSLLNWPAALMNESTLYGQLRRPGIVDIDEADHTRLLTDWHSCLRTSEYTADLITRTTQWHRDTAAALDLAEQALAEGDTTVVPTALAAATAVFLDVMSTHIVNWLLPEGEWEDLLARLLGGTSDAVDCLLALMTPTTTGHLLNAHIQLLDASQDLTTGAPVEHIGARLAVSCGTLFGTGTPATTAMPLEDPARAAAAARAITDPESQHHAIATALRHANTDQRSWAAATLLAAAGDTEALIRVQLITALCAWAADSEESRKILRHRYLAAARRWCALDGADPATITTADLCLDGVR